MIFPGNNLDDIIEELYESMKSFADAHMDEEDSQGMLTVLRRLHDRRTIPSGPSAGKDIYCH